ncbi:integrase, catalytic region, zinc finger, CCHC-type containing protein [Tanacetum coccineum]|uniref:Integrase, catalytic region, zinc finger, CCHC-type containing protein n=1 Tax=Tanacetum coccineum TaxID=301880 RepID=A0ABQ5HAI0_9ASTR
MQGERSISSTTSPEWSRFVTVSQTEKEIDTVSISQSCLTFLKQFPNEITTNRHQNLKDLNWHQHTSNLLPTRPSASTRRPRQKRDSPNQLLLNLSRSRKTEYPNKLGGIRIAKNLALLAKADWLEDTDEEIDEQELKHIQLQWLKIQRSNPHYSVSRPPLKKLYQVKDKVVPNISQVKFTKKEVEDNHRISSISKKTKSVTACNDSLNSRTSNVNAVMWPLPISASKPKRKANKSVATPHKKTVASDTTIQKSKSYYKELYENTNQEWKWWIAKRCPTEISGYCSFWGNDQFAPILGYGDLIQGNVMIKRVLLRRRPQSQSLSSVGQFPVMLIWELKVITVRTDRGTEILEQKLMPISKKKGIEHQLSTPRTPEARTALLKDRNRTLVEAARGTLHSSSKLIHYHFGLSFATANAISESSIIISTHGKTA